jgi:hypothetical protein
MVSPAKRGTSDLRLNRDILSLKIRKSGGFQMLPNKKLIAAVLVALGMLFSRAALATSVGGSGTITYVYVYGDGSVLVGGINFPSGQCQANDAFFIPGSNPNISKLLATVLAAKAAQMPIQVNADSTSGCWRPTIGTDTNTLIAIS